MMFAAVSLCPMGGIVRDEETMEALTEEVGNFESENEAIAHACLNLQCDHLHNGVISRGKGKGGYMVVTTQELEEV
ncbi:hypothetical protein L3V77_24150 [Vibrio sp. DW001]|uniref:hypothetical protein n=1 Tax=Vibrio sp. DW001 TaxID=2912315 RepID=UPI0023B0F322|nr:hypothetical protein [Vibrio sp. DW001]WED29028.1 hypothetical protein L3V77_24150 [Vibrio sp. DW001]